MTQQNRILARIEQLRTGATPFCVGTIVRTADATSAKAGAKAVITSDGVLEGYIGGGCVTQATITAAMQCICSGAPRMIRIKPNAAVDGPMDGDGTELYASGCPSGGTVDVFLEPMLAAPRVIVCGTSPVAQALLNIAKSVGMYTVSASHATDTSSPQGADAVVNGFDLNSLELQARDSVVVVTQGRYDKPALLAACQSHAGYLGMVGSRKKLAVLKSQLADQVSAERFAALRGPAGLDIGAIAPEEIALSIVAEIIAFRRRQASHDIADNQQQA